MVIKMRKIESLQAIGEDTRKRKYLLPAAVAAVTGSVQSASELLIQKTLQIGLNETSYTVLHNDEIGENASVLLDFGCELHGGVRLMVFQSEGHSNPEMKITFGESIGEAESRIGEKGAVNAHSARQFTVPVPAWSDQEWGQTGFRYVKLELLSQNTTVMLKSVLAVFIYRDYEYLGDFHCSDQKLNEVYDTAVYTCHLNLQNLVWDGIKRDRLVWIGDMMPECLTIRDVFGAIPLVEESLEFVKDQTPLPGWMNGLSSYSMWWLMILWEWYLSSGNETFLEKQRAYVLSLVDQLCAVVNGDGTDSLADYFFDWPTHGSKAERSGVRCLLRLSLESGAKLSAYYKDETRKQRCTECRRNLDKQEEYAGDEKQILAFMGLTGILSREAAAVQIQKNGVSGFSTFLLYYILRVIAEGKSVNAAVEALKEYSAGMIDKGATTFWEDFDPKWAENSGRLTSLPQEGQKDIHGDFGAFCYKGFRHSLCHGWASGAVPFITEYVLGVQILEPGCRKLRICPNLGALSWAEGAFPTPYGVVTVSHKKDTEGNIVSHINAPDGIEIISDNCVLKNA